MVVLGGGSSVLPMSSVILVPPFKALIWSLEPVQLCWSNKEVSCPVWHSEARTPWETSLLEKLNSGKIATIISSRLSRLAFSSTQVHALSSGRRGQPPPSVPNPMRGACHWLIMSPHFVSSLKLAHCGLFPQVGEVINTLCGSKALDRQVCAIVLICFYLAHVLLQ